MSQALEVDEGTLSFLLQVVVPGNPARPFLLDLVRQLQALCAASAPAAPARLRLHGLTAFQRKLVYTLAAAFCLEHATESVLPASSSPMPAPAPFPSPALYQPSIGAAADIGSRSPTLERAITLTVAPQSRVPARLLATLLHAPSSPSSSPAPSPSPTFVTAVHGAGSSFPSPPSVTSSSSSSPNAPMRLLKRPQADSGAPVPAPAAPSAPAAAANTAPPSSLPPSRAGNGAVPRPASATSLAEREEAYEQARQRIFGAANAPKDGDVTDDQIALQRWLKAQPARSETRDDHGDDDDDPDFRRAISPQPQFSPLLPTPSALRAGASSALVPSPSVAAVAATSWPVLAMSASHTSVWAPLPVLVASPGHYATPPYPAPNATTFGAPPSFTLQLQGADAALAQTQRWLTHRGIPVRVIASAALPMPPSLLARFSSPSHAQAELEALPQALHGALACSAWLGPPL